MLTASTRNTDPLLDEAAAAAYLSVAKGTLGVWRCTNRYPLPFVKVGRAVRYRQSALDNFLASREVHQGEASVDHGGRA
ncbi:MAG: helix-turn-helix domain-containing protein [Candidatus Accumulibacter similis]|nr:MAG: helix-turn-helix domain-containing protein [Candidatus Accumulibacter similis]